MRIALYHNLGPGGALRALAEMTRRSSARHEYTLYESSETRELRVASGMQLELDDGCVTLETRELPSSPVGRLPVGALWPLRHLYELHVFEQALAAEIGRGGFDVVAVHPCRFRYTPAILRALAPASVYFMQEPRRPSFEHRMRARRLADAFPSRHGNAGLDRATQWLVEDRLRAADRVTMAAFRGNVLCNSYHSAERILAAYGIEAQVSYLGVDPRHFTPRPQGDAPGPNAARERRSTVVSVGRIEPLKRYEMVVDALATLPIATRPALTIVGCDGTGTSYEAALQARATAAGVELVLVADADDDGLVQAYRSAVATVCTAELEPFGLTALESIASGTPVVAIRQGGYRESVVDGVTGVLVDATPSGVASGIARVLRDRGAFDPQALHATVVADGWTWDDATARYEAHLQAAAHRRG